MAMLPNSLEGKASPFLARVENLHQDLESERGSYMARAKAIREDIKLVYGEAKEAGVPAKSLRGVVKYRALEKKQRAIGDGLDIDEQSTYEMLVEALGDFSTTELGSAAVSKAKPRKSKNGKAEPDLSVIAAAMDADEHAAEKARDAEAFKSDPFPAA